MPTIFTRCLLRDIFYRLKGFEPILKGIAGLKRLVVTLLS